MIPQNGEEACRERSTHVDSSVGGSGCSMLRPQVRSGSAHFEVSGCGTGGARDGQLAERDRGSGNLQWLAVQGFNRQDWAVREMLGKAGSRLSTAVDVDRLQPRNKTFGWGDSSE